MIVKNKAGRPSSYNKKYARQAYELAKVGANDKEIASIIGIDQKTLIRWKREFDEFCQSICNGRNDHVFYAKKSLYRRAIGYRYSEVTKQAIKLDGRDGPDIPATVVKTVSKHMAPDVGACVTILKNSKTKEW